MSQNEFDEFMSSDQWAVDIGREALRISLLMNAVAALALFMFAGQSGDAAPALLAQIEPFLWGSALAALAASIAYLYQSAVTHTKYCAYIAARDGKPLDLSRGLRRFVAATGVAMIGLVVASMAKFIQGAFAVSAALAG